MTDGFANVEVLGNHNWSNFDICRVRRLSDGFEREWEERNC